MANIVYPIEQMSIQFFAQMMIEKRLKQIIQDNNLNIKDFSHICDIPYRSLQNYLRGERTIGIDALIKINVQLGININWLLTGKGEMYKEMPIQSDLNYTLNWLNEWWENADEKHRNWLEVQMKRCFPEYAEWIAQQEKSSRKS